MNPAASPPPDALTGLGQMLFGLFVVLAILIACVWLLKRYSIPGRSTGLLKIISATALGPHERAVLLEVGGKVLLLGVTSNNVRTLHVFGHDELPHPEVRDQASGVTPVVTPVVAFAKLLRQALQGRRDDVG
jgi:flagellar protein FliO/FliZ